MHRLLLLVLLACAAPLGSRSAAAPGVPLAAPAFVAALGRELSAHFNLEGELQLELLRPWSPPAATAAAWSVEVIEYPAAPTSSLLLRCRILADAAPVAELSVLLRASLWRDAWVARAPLASGAVFDPSQLETRRTDFFRERDALPASAGDHHQVFARAVAAGRPLTWRDLARRPLVRRGDVVEVAAVEGRLVVTMKAVAMDNGAQGDTVTVRNPESQRKFAAVVVDEHRVQVRF